MTNATTQFRERARDVLMVASRLRGAQQATAARKSALVQNVSEAKARLDLRDEINNAFEALQARAHQRSVGTLEALATAMLDDVMPNEGSIRLIPKFRDNTTWLDVMVEKRATSADGVTRPVLEDVLDANGGSMTNVVSASLRFAALMRTQNRPLMVLDEPDCWMSADRVPPFVDVIAQVAEQTGVQTIFISHFNKPELFSGRVNVVRLARDANGDIYAEPQLPIVHEWTDNDAPGLRSIELHNFRAHVKTVIPCYPGATALIGTVNLGKSAAVAGALKAVAYGESDDTMVNHNADQARIVLHLEKNLRVEWTRSLKKSPTVMYRLFEGDTLLHEGRPTTRNSAPEWVAKVLRISRLDDMDVQIGNQKSPVFLLNESASRRAQILSLGKESGHLRSLMKAYESVRGADNETVRSGEQELTRIEHHLKAMAGLDELYASSVEFSQAAENLVHAQLRKEQLAGLLQRLDESGARLQRAEAELAALRHLPAMPELHDLTRLGQLADQVERGERMQKALVVPTIPALPELHDLSGLARLIPAIARGERIAAELVVPEVPALPELHDLTILDRLVQKVDRGEQLLARLVLPEVPELPELHDTALVALMGERLVKSEARVKALSGDLPVVPALPDLMDLDQLGRMLELLVGSEARVATANSEFTTAVADESAAKEALDTLKLELGVCPLCDHALTNEHEGHVHV